MGDLVTIAVCSIGERLYDFCFPEQKLRGFTHRVFLQSPIFLNKIPNHVNIQIVDGVGVNKSRNVAIMECNTKYLYFADDDLTVNYENIQKMLDQIERMDLDGVIYFGSVCDELNKPRKKYLQSITKLNKFNSGKHGASEMIVDVATLKASNLQFDESYGAGTARPIGDEYLLVSAALRKGLSVFSLPIMIAQHPRRSSGGDLTFRAFVSRASVLRRVFPVIHPLLLFLLTLKVIFRRFC